jgi:hypothetical protein
MNRRIGLRGGPQSIFAAAVVLTLAGTGSISAAAVNYVPISPSLADKTVVLTGKDLSINQVKEAGLEPLVPFGADDSELESTNSYATAQVALMYRPTTLSRLRRGCACGTVGDFPHRGSLDGHFFGV